MPIERTGVELVAEGAASYIQMLGDAERATNSYVDALRRFAGEADAVKGAFSGIGAASQGTKASLAETGTEASNLFSTLVGANFVSNIVTQAFNTVTSAVMDFTRGAVGAVLHMQNLEITLESLIAREYVQAGAADTVSDAMGMVGYAADDLLLKIKDLSVASPFEYSQIVEVFTMNMQFGQTSESALELTAAITDLAAVNKGIPGVLQRVTYNFSQMAMMNRITSRDVKDLRMAGLDMARVFDEQLGMSIQQVDSALQSGKMSFDEVNRAFIEFSKKNYGGAAAKAATTLEGLMSTFNDVMFFLSADIFKPVIDRITVAASDILSIFQGIIDSGAFKWIGATMDVAAEEAIKFLGTLIPLPNALKNVGDAAAEVSGTIGDPFNDALMEMANTALSWAESAFSWGVNLITQFSSGIIEGAASTLSSAMDFLSGMLSWFMAPGSPPRIAPEVDAWGTSTMEEFLKGFQQADFSVLGNLTGTFKNVFSAILEGADVSKVTLGFSKELAAIMSGGTGANTDFYDRLKQSAGEYGNALASLVEMQLELAAAAKKAEENQNALAAAQEAFQKASDSASALVSEYNRLLESGAGKETLKAKRAQVKAALEQRNAAKQTYIETAKTASEDKIAADGLQDKIKLQQMLLSQLLEYAKLQKESEKAEKEKGKAAKAEGAPRGGATAPNLPDREYKLPSFGGAAEDAAEEFEDMKEKIKEKFSGIFAPLVAVYDERIKPMFDKLKASWNTLVTTISSAWNRYVVPVIEWLKGLIPQETFDNIVRVVGQVVGFIGTILLLEGAVSSVAAIIGGVLTAAFAALTSPIGLIIIGLTALKLAWDNNFLGMRDVLLEVWGFLQPIFIEVADWLKVNIPIAVATAVEFWNTKLVPALQDFWTWVQDNLIPLFESIGNFLSAVWTLAITAAKGAWETLQEVLTKFWKDTLVPFYEDSLKPLLEMLEDFLSPALEVLAGWWGILETAVRDLWNNTMEPFYNDVLVPFLDTFTNLTGFVSDATAGFDGFADALNNLTLPDWLTPGSPTPLENGIRGLLDVISADGILGKLIELGESFGSIYENAGGFYTLISGSLVSALDTLTHKIGTLLVSAMSRVSVSVKADLIPTFNDFSATLIRTVVPAITNLSTSLGTAATSSVLLSGSWNSMRSSTDEVISSIYALIVVLDDLVYKMKTSYTVALQSHVYTLISVRNAWDRIADSIMDAVNNLAAYNLESKKISSPPGYQPSSASLPQQAPTAVFSSNLVTTPARTFSGNTVAGQASQQVTYQYVLNANVPAPVATIEHGFRILQVLGGAG